MKEPSALCRKMIVDAFHKRLTVDETRYVGRPFHNFRTGLSYWSYQASHVNDVLLMKVSEMMVYPAIHGVAYVAHVDPHCLPPQWIHPGFMAQTGKDRMPNPELDRIVIIATKPQFIEDARPHWSSFEGPAIAQISIGLKWYWEAR
jgi:hypothetical protein